RNDVVDVVERAAAALVDDIEQSERTGAAVAQHKLRDRTAQLLVESRKRSLRDAARDHGRAELARIDDRLAAAVGPRRVHRMRGIAEQKHGTVAPSRD